MVLSRNAKIGLVAFVIFDLLLVLTLVSLYSIRSQRDLLTELNALGMSVYPEPIPLTTFQLTDQFGDSFTEQDLSGHWSILLLGYTNCPDVCPLTMAELKQFYERLDDPEIKHEARIVMVSVDIARDTPATMASYVNSFNRDFIGLSGDEDAISRLARQLFVAHSVTAPMPDHSEHDDTNDDGYVIEHSSHLAIINKAGQLQAVVRQPIRDQDLSKAFRLLINR
jgi:protein SCO1/2